jgi:DnaJ homolog subfamily A member 2
MPSFRHHDFGNLYIQFDVKFPVGEDMRHLELLEKVLPPRPRQIQPPADAMIEDFDLEDVDPRGQARAQGAAGPDEDEEDGIPHGAERMQCASQ